MATALPVAGLGVHVKGQGMGKAARRDRPQAAGTRLSSRIHLEPQAEQLDRLGPGVGLGRLFRLGPLLVPEAENGCPDAAGVEPQLALAPSSPRPLRVPSNSSPGRPPRGNRERISGGPEESASAGQGKG